MIITVDTATDDLPRIADLLMDMAGWNKRPFVQDAVVIPPPPAPLDAVAELYPTIPVPPAPDMTTPVADLDSDGKPWDAAFHSSSRAKIANGTWKKKRGAESPTVPAAPVDPSAMTFATMMQQLAAKIAAGQLNPETITAAVISAGLQNLPQLAARPDLVPTVAHTLGLL